MPTAEPLAPSAFNPSATVAAVPLPLLAVRTRPIVCAAAERVVPPVSWQYPAFVLLIVTKSPAVVVPSKVQAAWPSIATCALPDVPALPTTMPIMPSLSLVKAAVAWPDVSSFTSEFKTVATVPLAISVT